MGIVYFAIAALLLVARVEIGRIELAPWTAVERSAS